jgi:tetratricopeptide (TPR) repeat protein
MGLCYRDKGDLAEALKQITHSIDENFKNGAVGTYDYLHRAVTYMKLNQWNLALEDLQLQFNNYPQFPDTYYYLSLVYIQNNDRAQALTQLQKAKSLYTKNHRADPYVIMPDQIFESDIDEKIEEVQSLLTR